MNEIDPAHRFSPEAVRKFDGPTDGDVPGGMNDVARQVASQYRRDTMSPVMVSGVLRLVEFALLFVSGIPGFDAQGALPDGFDAQFANVVVNIKRVLDEAGATTRDLVKVNVLLTRASDVAAMNALYAGAFGPPPYPARTTCVVQALPDPKMLIEIEAVASLSK